MKERWGEKGDFFGRKSKVSLKRCNIEQNIKTECGYKLVHIYIYIYGDIYNDVTWPQVSSRPFQVATVSVCLLFLVLLFYYFSCQHEAVFCKQAVHWKQASFYFHKAFSLYIGLETMCIARSTLRQHGSLAFNSGMRWASQSFGKTKAKHVCYRLDTLPVTKPLVSKHWRELTSTDTKQSLTRPCLILIHCHTPGEKGSCTHYARSLTPAFKNWAVSNKPRVTLYHLKIVSDNSR